MTERRTGKTPLETPQMRAPAHGRGMLRVGGSNRGGPGRPTAAFSNLCKRLLADPKARTAARDVLADRKSPHWFNLYKLLTHYSEGRPPERVDVEIHDPPNAAAVRERIAGRLETIEQRLALAARIENAPDALHQIVDGFGDTTNPNGRHDPAC